MRTFLTVLLLLGISVLWLIRKDLVGTGDVAEPALPKMVQMVDVRVRSFGSGSRVLELRGSKILSNAEDTEMDLEPVEGLLREEGRETVRFRAAHARKRATKAGDTLEFRGGCRAASDDGRWLESELLLYYPRTGMLESPGRATLVTSDTTLAGDRFETSTQLKTGLVTGKVVITTTRLPSGAGAGPATSEPVELTGDSANFDVPKGIYQLEGHAAARKAQGTMRANRMLYQARNRFLQASGAVTFTDPSYELSAGVVEYDLPREWVSARESPRATLTSAGRGGETRLSARTVAFDRPRAHVLAEGDVTTRVVPERGVPYDIRSRTADSFYRDRRSLFKGEVRIRSTEMGADGDRAVIYELTEKVHILGDARAWRVERGGRIDRTVQGDHIIHDMRTGRSVALRNVRLEDRSGSGHKLGTGERRRVPGAREKARPGAESRGTTRQRRTLRLR